MSGKSWLLILTLALSGVSLSLSSKQTHAQTPEAIYLILDASGSMLGQLPDRSRKIEVAKQVLQEFVTRDFSGYELALRVYGHRRKDDCADSELLVPFGPPTQTVAQMRRAVPQIRALGHTPITYSLREALKDFGQRRGEIILISDGIESCDADPCALVREWRKRNVKIRVHVVGFGLDEKAKETLRCISQAAGTEYHDAGSAAALANELARIHQQSGAAGFWLRGLDGAGKRTLVHGTLARNGQTRYQVSSSRSYRVEAGQYLAISGSSRTADRNIRYARGAIAWRAGIRRGLTIRSRSSSKRAMTRPSCCAPNAKLQGGTHEKNTLQHQVSDWCCAALGEFDFGGGESEALSRRGCCSG